LLLAVVAAFGTGLIQAAWVGVRVLSGRLVWEGPDIGWMAPLSYLVPLVPAGLVGLGIGALLRRRWPMLYPRQFASAAVLGLAALAVLLFFARLYPIAKVLIALGVALRASGPVSLLSVRQLRRAAGALAGVVLLVGAGTVGLRWWSERRAVASLPAPAAGSPNVLLLILDTVRAQSLSLYGYFRPTTPALERWARQGVTFDWAMSTAPWTLPSHAGMFTGQDADQQSGGWRRPLDRRWPTVAEVFRSRGYRTAGFVANTYYAGYDSGLDRGFDRYEDYQRGLTQIIWSNTLIQTNLGRALVWHESPKAVLRALLKFDLGSEPLRIAQRKSGAVVTDQFLRWQEGLGDAPFFAFVNFFDAHTVYKPPRKYRMMFRGTGRPRDLYDACIRYLDDQIDRLLSTLASRGVLDRTIVLITADHGEYFREHGRSGHGNGVNLEVLRVPLVIRYPARVPADRRVPALVSLRDLPQTMLDLAGFTDAGFPGRSLGRHLGDSTAPVAGAVAHEVARARFFFEQDAYKPPERQRSMEALFTDRVHWIRGPAGEESLYAFRDDPEEAKDLSDAEGYAAVRDSLRALARTPPARVRRAPGDGR
jgi:arylsulfatase A-like enzyme